MIQNIIDEMIFPSLYTGFVFTVIAGILNAAPPGEINGVIGYRTSSSMKSQERWDFAQKYSSKVMLVCGLAMIILSALGYFIPNDVGYKQELGIGLIIASAVVLIAVTELAIRKRFKGK